MDMSKWQDKKITQLATAAVLLAGISVSTSALAEAAFNSEVEAKATQGSGVLVSRAGHVVTNRHVVQKGCRQAFIEDYTGRRSRAQVLRTSKSDDVAILSTDYRPAPNRYPHGVLRVNAAHTYLELPRQNESVHIAGYPDGEFGPRGGFVRSLQDPVHIDRGFTIGLTTTYGASGGQVLDDDGLLVGIVWGGRDDESRSTAYAVSTLTLLPLLRSEGVKVFLSSSTNAPNRRQPGESMVDAISRVIGVGMQATVRVFCLQ
jgi:S1-C subfamily serine protease